MSRSLQTIYEDHHATERADNFSVLEKDRGEALRRIVGKEKRVLDIGCRDGALTKHFTEGNRVLGVDIDSIALNRAQSLLGIEGRVVDLNGDWEELKGESFDVIVAGEILEHLYYPEKVLRRVVKHLNPGGIFVGSVPNAFSLKNRLRYLSGQKRFTPLEDPTHINQFSYAELIEMLQKYFNNAEIVGLGRFRSLSRMFPNLVAFDLFFIAKNAK